MSSRRIVLVAAAFTFTACTAQESAKSAATDGAPLPSEVSATELAMFAALPARIEAAAAPATEAQIDLGRALFYENILSDGHDVSCNSCHALNGWGADGRRVSFGHDWRAGTRNSPTVYNAAGHVAHFWDGRAADVEEQAKGPILNPIEMGMPDAAAVLTHLRESPMYTAAFRAAFPGESDPISYHNVGRALGAFERGLVTPGRWDRFLGGDSTALTREEQQGCGASSPSAARAATPGPTSVATATFFAWRKGSGKRSLTVRERRSKPASRSSSRPGRITTSAIPAASH